MFYEKNDYIFLPNTTNIIENYLDMCFDSSTFLDFLSFVQLIWYKISYEKMCRAHQYVFTVVL